MIFRKCFAKLRGASSDLFAGVREGHPGHFGRRENAHSETRHPANFPPRFPAWSPGPWPRRSPGAAERRGHGRGGGRTAARRARSGRGSGGSRAAASPRSCRGKRSVLPSGGDGKGGAGAPPHPVLPYLPARSASAPRRHPRPRPASPPAAPRPSPSAWPPGGRSLRWQGQGGRCLERTTCRPASQHRYGQRHVPSAARGAVPNSYEIPLFRRGGKKGVRKKEKKDTSHAPSANPGGHKASVYPSLTGSEGSGRRRKNENKTQP